MLSKCLTRTYKKTSYNTWTYTYASLTHRISLRSMTYKFGLSIRF